MPKDCNREPFSHVVNMGPTELKNPGLAQYALNALTIANKISWEENFKTLISQSQRLNVMPNDIRCICALLEAAGFIRQPGVRDEIRVKDVMAYMNANCHDGQVALVKADRKMPFMAILPGDDGYHCYGLMASPGYYVSDIWIRWADGQDHSPVKRRKGHSRQGNAYKAPEDHEALHYLQKNPRERIIGDCVIRGLSAALDISWNEALERLAAASGYVDTTLNRREHYSLLLEQEGFICRKPLRINGKLLRGRDFCRELDRTLHRGERVFAHLGSSHVAAILPIREEDQVRYKIVDTWDSTARPIKDYWIWTPAEQETTVPGVSGEQAPSAPENPDLHVGTWITHPRFGRGRIQKVDPAGWASVVFPEGDSKKLACRWILSNCTVGAA